MGSRSTPWPVEKRLRASQLNLAAGSGQRVEVHVVNVDIALAVRLGEARIDDAHLVELLGRFGAILQHGAHGGIGVDVGVLALHVGIGGLGEGDVLQRLDEAGVHVAHAAALGTVEDVGLGGLHEAGLDEGFLHEILHALDRRVPSMAPLSSFSTTVAAICSAVARSCMAAHAWKDFCHRIGDLLGMEFRRASVALDDGLHHNFLHPFLRRGSRTVFAPLIAALPTTTCRNAAMFFPTATFRNYQGGKPAFSPFICSPAFHRLFTIETTIYCVL